jgi:tetratricopeptide (TPR) repeat protein
MKRKILFISIIIFLFSNFTFSQVLIYPPSGDNQKASVSQYMGLVEVNITYNSPDVHSPSGEDRKGKIWGALVPYGLVDLGFGESSEDNPSPWRAGANQNTTISFSHDVEVQGKSISAGTYGLFFIPEEGQWTLILSNDITSWGSYFYNPDHDALRVKATPSESEYNEFLTYEFDDRKLASCTAIMKWEDLAVSFELSVPNINDLYIEAMDAELKSNIGFSYQSWVRASSFCVNYDTHLEKGLEWADFAIYAPFIGEINFTTLSNKASVLYAMGDKDESDDFVMQSIKEPTATVNNIHNLGRQLIGENRDKLALEVLKFNYERYSKAWPTNLGMARGYSAVGDYKKALKYANKALKQAPDDRNKNNIAQSITKLEAGEDIN